MAFTLTVGCPGNGTESRNETSCTFIHPSTKSPTLPSVTSNTVALLGRSLDKAVMVML